MIPKKVFFYQRGRRPQGKVGVLRVGVAAGRFGLLQSGLGLEHLSAVLQAHLQGRRHQAAASRRNCFLRLRPRKHQRAEPPGGGFGRRRHPRRSGAAWLSVRASFFRRDRRKSRRVRRRLRGQHAGDTLGIEFDPDTAWDERENLFKMSGKIVRTSNITQSAIGNKDGLWTTVFAACAFINDDN